MKNPRLSRRLFLTGCALLALTVPVGASQQLPFKAKLVASTVATLDFPVLTLDVVGSGEATHLGRFNTVQQHFINLLVDPLAFYGGTYTFRAANGDTIFGGYSGRQVPTSTADLFQIDGEFTITGGTGRFEGATGGGAARGLTDLATGAAALTLEGTISSP